MARCKLTRMSLRNIRKDKQYQCIVIDFVRTGVISKSKAEELLNYSIPAGLLENSAYVPDDDEPGTGGEGTGEDVPPENPSGEGTGEDTPPVTTRTVAVKAYGMYQPPCGGPQLMHFRDEQYHDVNSLDIEISSNDDIDDVKDKILIAYNTKCGATDVDSSGNHTAGSLVAHPATEVIFITDVSFSSSWTEMNPQPSDISAFDGMDTIEVILR
jgi:hypothetical protein